MPLPLMHKYKRRCLRWAAFTLFLLVLSAGISRWRDWITVYPLDTPVALDSAQTIDQTIELRTPEYDQLVIRFAVHYRADLAGGKTAQLPPVRLGWQLLGLDGALLDQGTASTGNVSSIASDFIEHDLAILHFPQPQGTYHFKAHVLTPNAAYRDIGASLLLDSFSKGYKTWQLALLFWAVCAQILIIWPLAAMAAVVAVLAAYGWLRRRTPRSSPPAPAD